MAEDFFRIRKGIVVANTTASANLDPIQLRIGSTTVNGIGVYAATVNAGSITGITSLSITNITATTFNVGALFTANSTLVNAAAINVTNQINAASMFLSGQANVSTLFVSTSIDVGANVDITTTSMSIGNTSVNTFANSSSLRITGALNANSSIGTNLQGLCSDGTKAYWGDVERLGITRGYRYDSANDMELQIADAGKIVLFGKGTAGFIYVPNNATVALLANTYVNLGQWGAGQCTISPRAGVIIHSRNGMKLGGQYAMATIVQINPNEWVLGGDVTA